MNIKVIHRARIKTKTIRRISWTECVMNIKVIHRARIKTKTIRRISWTECVMNIKVIHQARIKTKTIRRISWTECVMNIKVIHRARIKTKTQQQLFGHIVGQEGIQREILERLGEGERGRGRQRVTWTDNIKAWMGNKGI